MPDGTSLGALAIQVFFAIVSVEYMRWRVLPRVSDLPLAGLYLDVWIPVAIVTPFLFLLSRTPVSGNLGSAWLPLAGPIACGLCACGAALMVHRAPVHKVQASDSMLPFAIGATGVTILLLGAAHDLTLWMGQFAFATAAVLLWFNTPDEPIPMETDATDAMRCVSGGVVICVLAGLGHGIAGSRVADAWAPISAGITMLSMVMIVAHAASLAGSNVAIRIGAWVMVFGLLLSVGILSVQHLVQESWSALHGGEVHRLRRLVFGFGDYWIEGISAAFIGVMLKPLLRGPRWIRSGLGFLLLAGTAAVVSWRISRL